jgi:hypothetical protein
MVLNSAEITQLSQIAPFYAVPTSLAKFIESATDLELPSDYIRMMILAIKTEALPSQISLR